MLGGAGLEAHNRLGRSLPALAGPKENGRPEGRPPGESLSAAAYPNFFASQNQNFSVSVLKVSAL